MTKLSWRPSGKQLGFFIVFAFVAVVAAANAHLVHVAFRSQPDCVLGNETPGKDGVVYRAAKPAC